MASTNAEKIKDEVVRLVALDKAGRSASDLVQAVASAQNVQTENVRQVLRTLLEKGALIIGPDLNLHTRNFLNK
jgi:hypothetical protein